MGKGMDWRRAAPKRETQCISDDGRDIAIFGLPSRPRRPQPSKAELCRQAAEALKTWQSRQRDERDDGVKSEGRHDG